MNFPINNKNNILYIYKRGTMSRILDMITTINRLNGLTTLNRFSVQITPPQILVNKSRDIPFLCETVNLPGIQFTTEQIKYKGYGLIEKRPTSMEMDDITATFFIDNSNVIMGFFQKWMQMVYSFDPNHSRDKVHGMSLESFNYPGEYYGTMVISVKNVGDENVIEYTLEDVYPLNMGAITLGWENNDQVARLAVTFAYRSFSTGETLNTSTAQNTSLDTSSNNRNLGNISVEEAVNQTTSFIV
jgi:hypothetical protein